MFRPAKHENIDISGLKNTAWTEFKVRFNQLANIGFDKCYVLANHNRK